MLLYAVKLTLTPGDMTLSDINGLRDAGFADRDILDIVEVTAYYARVLKQDVPLALDVVADILRNPVFDPKEIEIERGVILQEIGQALDTPDDVIFDWLQEAAYPDQPMGRTILGPAEKVRSFAFLANHSCNFQDPRFRDFDIWRV